MLPPRGLYLSCSPLDSVAFINRAASSHILLLLSTLATTASLNKGPRSARSTPTAAATQSPQHPTFCTRSHSIRTIHYRPDKLPVELQKHPFIRKHTQAYAFAHAKECSIFLPDAVHRHCRFEIAPHRTTTASHRNTSHHIAICSHPFFSPP